MQIRGPDHRARAACPAPLPVWRAQRRRRASGSSPRARVRARAGGRLVALWGSDRRGARPAGFAVMRRLRAGRRDSRGCELPLAARRADLSRPVGASFPCAARMQRAAYDLLGMRADGARDTAAVAATTAPGRADRFPLRQRLRAAADGERGEVDDYPFVRVDGDGVHEIPVGPGARRHHRAGALPLLGRGREGAAAGGAARLHAQGHREALHRAAAPRGHRLAGRVSGDSTVAYAWAYCMALGVGARLSRSRRARAWLRALLLERERVANHLGDLGALGNDAGARLRAGAVLAAAGGLAARSTRRVRPPAADGLRSCPAASRVDRRRQRRRSASRAQCESR